jgi:SAM-dependent methyltransferase
MEIEGEPTAHLGSQVHTHGHKYNVRSVWLPRETRSLLVVRDPAERIASAFLDKVVLLRETYYRSLVARFHKIEAHDVDPRRHGISFEDFVEFLLCESNARLDWHVRPQTDFIHELEYTHFVDLKVPGSLELAFEQLGVPYTPFSGHELHHASQAQDTSGVWHEPAELASASSATFFEAKITGFGLPSPANLLTPSLKSMLEERYRDDYVWLRQPRVVGQTIDASNLETPTSSSVTHVEGHGRPAPSDWVHPSSLQNIVRAAAGAAARFGVRPEIHIHDNLFLFLTGQQPAAEAVSAYFDDGRLSGEMLVAILEELGTVLGSDDSLLEFASGHGRVTRHLPDLFPSSRIVACDIHPSAVEFVSTTLGVESVMSSAHSEGLQLGEEFDVVFALSFLSHVAPAIWQGWVHALTRCVKTGGLLVFTTHGRGSAPARGLGDFGSSWYGGHSDQPDLDEDVYGTSIVTEEFVAEAVAAAGLELLRFLPAYWWGHQDCYVYRRTA